jgi:CHAT domain-containing protein
MKPLVRLCALLITVATLTVQGCSTVYVDPSVQVIFHEAEKAAAQGQIHDAEAYYNKGLRQAKNIGDELGMAIAFFALGNIYRASKESEKATAAFAASLEHLAAAKNPLTEGLTLNNIAYFEYQDGHYEKTIELADRASSIWDALLENSSEQTESIVANRAAAHMLKAESLRNLKQFNAAVEAYRLVISDFRATNDHAKLGTSLYLVAELLRTDLKKPNESISYFLDAIPLLDESGDHANANYARLSLGITYLGSGGRREDFAKAAYFLQEASRVANEKGLATQIGYAHLFSGRALEELGRYEEALEHYQQFLQHDRKKGGGDYTDPVNYEFLEAKAQIYRNLSRYEEAIANYRAALLKCVEMGNEKRQAFILTMLAEIYAWIGDSDRAIQFYKQALKLYERNGDTINQINVLSALAEQQVFGGVSAAEGYEYLAKASTLLDSVEGLNLLKSILDSSVEKSPTREQIDAMVQNQLRNFDSWSLMVAGNLYQRAGRIGGAIGQVDSGLLFVSLALKYHGAVPPFREAVFEIGKDWYLMAEGYRQKQTFDAALEAFKLAEEIARFLRTPEIHWIYAGIARTYEDSGDYQSAVAYYRKGLDTLESIHQQQGMEESKIGVFAGALYAYDGVVPLLLKLHQTTNDESYMVEAFQTTERLKDRAFREMVSVYRGARHGGDFGEIAARIDEIRLEMRMINDQLAQIRTRSAEGAMLLDRFEELQKALANLRIEEGKHNRGYAAMLSPAPVSLKRIQQSLSSDTAILEYTISDQHIVIWAITRDAVNYASIRKTEKPILRDFLKTLREPLIGSTEARNHIALGEELYKTFVGPVEEYLRNVKHLIIVPDGELNYLPFETLIQRGSGLQSKLNRTLAEVPYLIKRFEISYFSSAGVFILQQAQARSSTPTLPLLAFGDPVYRAEVSTGNEDKQQSAGIQNITLRGREFRRLEFSGEEVRRIASVWNIPTRSEHINLREEASVERLSQLDLSRYHILHFASHAVLGDKVGLASQPALILSQIKSTVNQKESLEFADILKLKLNADLVVLSACETGLGQLRGGEGIVGLTRAFFYAGAASTVVSLWKVEDQSTSLFMERFYHRLKNGQNKADAIREAKLDIMRSKITLKSTGTEESLAAPFFWAPFILVGDWGPILFN